MDEDALFAAAESGDVDALRRLADAGADLDHRGDGWLGPAIVLAANNGHSDAARFLLERGVAIPPSLLAVACYSHRLRRRREPEHLMWLIRELVLERDVDPNYCDAGDPPALCVIDDAALAGFLIDNGADVTVADEEGDTPLHNAARIGDLELIGLLLERGADPRARNNHGQTPADIAREEKAAKLIAALGGR